MQAPGLHASDSELQTGCCDASQTAFVADRARAPASPPATLLSARSPSGKTPNMRTPGITPVRRNPFDPPARDRRLRAAHQPSTPSLESSRSSSAPSLCRKARSENETPKGCNAASVSREFPADGARLKPLPHSNMDERRVQVAKPSPETSKNERSSEVTREQTPPSAAHSAIRLQDKMPGEFPVDALGNPVCLSTPEPVARSASRKKYTMGSMSDILAGAAGLVANRGPPKKRACLEPNTELSPFYDQSSEFLNKRAGVLTQETIRPRGLKPTPGWVSRRDNQNLVSGEQRWENKITKVKGPTGVLVKVSRDIKLSNEGLPDDILNSAGISVEEMKIVDRMRLGNGEGANRRAKIGPAHTSSTVGKLVWGHDLHEYSGGVDEAWVKKFEGAAGQPSDRRYR